MLHNPVMINTEQDPVSQSLARKLEAKILRLAQQGRMKQAIADCQQLNKRYPGFASGWYTTSQLASRLGNATVALRAAEQAIALEPAENRWQLQKAFCLMQAGDPVSARTIAMTLDGKMLESGYQCSSLGLLLSRLGENEKALVQYQRAIAAEPERGEHYYNLATVQRFLGDFSAAASALEQAIERNPEDFDAYKLRSDLRTQTADNNNVESLRQALRRFGDKPRACVQLHYSMAKELEDLEQWPESFAHLQQGASERRKLMRYDLRGDLDTMAKLAEVYNPSLFGSAATGFENSEPIFILGMPRTGTTLVERIIGSHSAVYAAGELNNFALEMVNAVKLANGQQAGAASVTKAARVAQSATVDFSRLGEAYINSTRPLTGELAHFIDKMPVNFLYAGLIHLALPRAKIIHLKRHPLDTCYAIFKNLFADAYPFSYHLEELAKYYAAYERLMTHWHRVMPGVIIDIHYEAVVADVEQSSRELLQFCGLPWEAQCLKFYQNPAASTTASASQVRQPVYSSSVGKWRRFATELQPLIAQLEIEGVVLPAD